MAVKDYFEMFPEDWELCKVDIEYQRQNLKTEFAEVEGTHNIKRALFSVPEKLAAMIGQKLTNEELLAFKGKEESRWFAEQYPQFAISTKI